MNEHIGDDELLWFHYGDGLTTARREQIAQRLGSELELARRYQQLRAELLALPAADEAVPAAAAQARWRLRLDQRASANAARPRHRAGGWRLAFAGATLVLLGVAIGTRLADQASVASPPAVTVAATEAVAPSAGDRGLARGLRTHLGDARLLLAELPDDPLRRRALVDEVITQNRVYVRLAQAEGDERLARVLRAFEPVLESLAEVPARPGDDLGAKAQADFEFAVLQTKLSRSPSKIVQSL